MASKLPQNTLYSLKATKTKSFLKIFQKITQRNFFPVKPFCKPDQTTVYGVAKREKIHVSCEVVANPSDNLYFNWVFNSSSERLDLQENLISNQGSKSVAEHTPQVNQKLLISSIVLLLKSLLALKSALF